MSEKCDYARCTVMARLRKSPFDLLGMSSRAGLPEACISLPVCEKGCLGLGGCLCSFTQVRVYGFAG